MNELESLIKQHLRVQLNLNNTEEDNELIRIHLNEITKDLVTNYINEMIKEAKNDLKTSTQKIKKS